MNPTAQTTARESVESRPTGEPRWGAPAALGVIALLTAVLTTVIVTRPAAAPTDSDERRPTRLQTYHLSDLPYTAVANGLGPVERDLTNGGEAPDDGQPLTIGEYHYDRGLGVHAPSHVRLYTATRCERFTAAVGVTGDATTGTVRFTVLGDGQTLHRSGPVAGGAGPVAIDLDISGVQRLDLIVDDDQDGTAGDAAAWADAQLQCRP